MPTLHEALLTYLQVDRSPATNQQYGMVLSHLVTAIGPQRDIRLVRYEDLVDYFAQLRQRGLKDTTRAGYLQIVKTFFTWSVERRYIECSPATGISVRKTHRSTATSRAIPTEELQRMVDLARVTSKRNHAMLLFLADTGCRVGGLVSLTLDNLHLEEGWALLTEKGQVEHRALFGEQTAQALQLWLRKRPKVAHSYVWTGKGPDHAPLTTGGVAAIVRRLAQYTEASRPWGPHSIRHAVGHAWAKRAPVTATQRKLGHASPAITMSYYYPDDDAYLEQLSRRNALAVLEAEDEPSEHAPLRIVEPKADAGAG